MKLDAVLVEGLMKATKIATGSVAQSWKNVHNTHRSTVLCYKNSKSLELLCLSPTPFSYISIFFYVHLSEHGIRMMVEKKNKTYQQKE